MTTSMPTVSPKNKTQIAEFLSRAAQVKARLVFAIDATASRQPTWDTACALQGQMFEATAVLGGLQVQLVYFRGEDEFKASAWTMDSRDLAAQMRRVHCDAGHTQIGKVLAHVQQEHARQPVTAVVFVGDCCEENIDVLASAIESKVPHFVFQEGDDANATAAFKLIAERTHGAHCKFAVGAEAELAELLRAVAAFAVGGLQALENQGTNVAKKLLGQLK